MGRGAGAVGDVGIAGGVDHPPGQDRLAPGLRLGDDARHPVAIHDRGGEGPVEHWMDAGLLDERVGDQLEPLRVELVRLRLTLGNRRAHRCGAGLEFATDTVGLDGFLVAIPGHSLDADGGDVAAEAPEPLDQSDLHAGARRAKRRRQAGWPRTDHEHIGLVNHVDLARWLGDRAQPSGVEFGRHRHSLARLAVR